MRPFDQVSPSWIDNYEGCARAWFNKSILRKEMPEKWKFRALGDRVHKKTDAIVQAAIDAGTDIVIPEMLDDPDRQFVRNLLAALPKTPMLAEVPIQMKTWDGGPLFYGYVDYIGVQWSDIMQTGLPLFLDHKTVKERKWMKTPAELKTNTQMVMYARAAWHVDKELTFVPPKARREGFEKDKLAHKKLLGLVEGWRQSPGVVLKHAYATTVKSKAKKGPKIVSNVREATISRDEVETFWNEKMRVVAHMAGWIKKAPTDAMTLPPNFNHCANYGGCVFLPLCPDAPNPDNKSKLINPALLNRLKTNFTTVTSFTDSTPTQKEGELMSNPVPPSMPNLQALIDARTGGAPPPQAPVVTPPQAIAAPTLPTHACGKCGRGVIWQGGDLFAHPVGYMFDASVCSNSSTNIPNAQTRAYDATQDAKAASLQQKPVAPPPPAPPPAPVAPPAAPVATNPLASPDASGFPADCKLCDLPLTSDPSGKQAWHHAAGFTEGRPCPLSNQIVAVFQVKPRASLPAVPNGAPVVEASKSKRKSKADKEAEKAAAEAAAAAQTSHPATSGPAFATGAEQQQHLQQALGITTSGLPDNTPGASAAALSSQLAGMLAPQPNGATPTGPIAPSEISSIEKMIGAVPVVERTPDPFEVEAPQIRPFHLYIDCIPVKGEHRTFQLFEDWIAPTITALAKDLGQYHRLLDFSKGGPMLAVLIRERALAGDLPDVMVVSSMGADGRECIAALKPLASTVVHAMRG